MREAVYVVSLNEEEQEYLSDLVSKGKSAAIKIKHANMLLSLDKNGSNMSIDDVTRIFRSTEKPSIICENALWKRVLMRH